MLNALQQASAWTNQDNSFYYEHVDPRIQQGFAVRGGLASCCDVQIIDDYLQQAKQVLELGAGYGRVADYLMAHYPQMDLTLVERSPQFAEILVDKFQKHTNVAVLQQDLMTCCFAPEFDVILWLWSGLTDFAQFEQSLALKLIQRWLKPGGVLVIDTIPHDIKPLNANTATSQSYTVEVDNNVLNGYVPSPSQMLQAAQQLGYSEARHLEYVTTTQRKRDLYLLRTPHLNSANTDAPI